MRSLPLCRKPIFALWNLICPFHPLEILLRFFYMYNSLCYPLRYFKVFFEDKCFFSSWGNFIFPFPLSLSSPPKTPSQGPTLWSSSLLYFIFLCLFTPYSERVSQLSLSLYELALHLGLFIHPAQLLSFIWFSYFKFTKLLIASLPCFCFRNEIAFKFLRGYNYSILKFLFFLLTSLCCGFYSDASSAIFHI